MISDKTAATLEAIDEYEDGCYLIDVSDGRARRGFALQDNSLVTTLKRFCDQGLIKREWKHFENTVYRLSAKGRRELKKYRKSNER